MLSKTVKIANSLVGKSLDASADNKYAETLATVVASATKLSIPRLGTLRSLTRIRVPSADY